MVFKKKKKWAKNEGSFFYFYKMSEMHEKNVEKNIDKKYNVYFMNEIFNYINTRQTESQDIVIFNMDLLEAYVKK